MMRDTDLSRAFHREATSAASKRNTTQKRPSPISIRVTDEERAELLEAANGQSINSYVRDRLFKNNRTPRRKALIEDYQALARVLSALGQSDTHTRLTALLLAIEAGKLEVTQDAERDVRHACFAVKTMRADLVKALGLKA